MNVAGPIGIAEVTSAVQRVIVPSVQCQDSVHLPVAKNRSQDRIPIAAKHLTFAERQFVNGIENEVVSNIPSSVRVGGTPIPCAWRSLIPKRPRARWSVRQ